MNNYLRDVTNRPFVIPASILAAALLLGLFCIGFGLAHRDASNTISVTGSATQEVTADTASWTIDLTRSVSEDGLAGAYSALGSDASTVSTFFTTQKLASSSVAQGVITTSPNYSPNGGAPSSYSVSMSVTVSTSDVQKIDTLSHDLSSVQEKLSGGTILSPQSPAYYISTLPDLRVSLVGKAVADAKARAKEIAKSGGSSVGALSSASSGVVQVMPMNSTSVDDYGSYDTSTIQKQVMVTARANFYVQ